MSQFEFIAVFVAIIFGLSLNWWTFWPWSENPS